MLVQFLVHHLVHLITLKTYRSLLLPLVQFLVHILVHFIVLTTSYSPSLRKLLKTTDISVLLSDYTDNFLYSIHRHSLIVAQRQDVNTGNNDQCNHSIPDRDQVLSLKEAMNGPDSFGFMIIMDKEIRTSASSVSISGDKVGMSTRGYIHILVKIIKPHDNKLIK